MKITWRFLAGLAAACALSAPASCSEPRPAASSKTTYIHEFAHPRVVAHYHPRAGMQFLLEHAQYALDNTAHGLELDLHMRGGEAVCNHDGPTPQSPRLRDVVNLIVQYQGQKPTVHGDDRQFFLVLEPKDNDTALFQQVFDILGENLSHLSTGVASGGAPRGVTAVITGAWTDQLRAYFSDRIPELNRRCILENHDYSGEITNISNGAIPFQWTAIRHPGEVGRVNALHAGTDTLLKGRYNIRVWGAGPNYQAAFFSGADSINCDHEQLVPFQEFVRHQGASGQHPSLAVRDDRVVLAWRGAFSKNLYVSLGTASNDELTFARQLNLTAFLTDQPQGFAPAAALLPGGRLLLVYEEPADRRLWYVSGKFTSADRYLTFSGDQKRLTSGEGVAVRGTQPTVAAAPDGRAIIVYRAPDGHGLRYMAARMGPTGELWGEERVLALGSAAEGDSPSAAINAKGQLLLAYRNTLDGQIHAITGALDVNGDITGTDTTLSTAAAIFAADPAAALDDAGNARIMWTIGDKALNGFRGTLGADEQFTGMPFTWKAAGNGPSVAFAAPGIPLAVYSVPGGFSVSPANAEPGVGPRLLDIGMDPL